MKRILATLMFYAALLAGAASQPIQPIYTAQVWLPQSKLSPAITVTTSSAATLLPVITGQSLPGMIAWLCNTGSADAYVAFGTANSVAATVAGSSWLKAATCAAYPLNLRPGVTYTYVAIIGAGATTVTVETGIGTPPLSIASSGGGGGGGAVTIASGAVASGAYSSGSIASGAFASGSIASGSLASGSISAGALAIGAGVDGWDLSVGARADAACGTDNGTCALLSLLKRANQNLTTLNNTAAGPIPTQAPTVSIGGVGIKDAAGTNTAAVKAASTAPVATDPALVVTLSQNAGLGASATPVRIDPTGTTPQPASQSGTWTVQPGNTANTTPWLANPTTQYPSGATPITASATGTTGATTATLAGTSGKTTYICGYSIRANATAAATVTNTITGVITATLSSVMWVAPLASGLGIDEQIFSPCIPASATNTGIAIVSGAPGAGGTVSSKGWGYQL